MLVAYRHEPGVRLDDRIRSTLRARPRRKARAVDAIRQQHGRAAKLRGQHGRHSARHGCQRDRQVHGAVEELVLLQIVVHQLRARRNRVRVTLTLTLAVSNCTRSRVDTNWQLRHLARDAADRTQRHPQPEEGHEMRGQACICTCKTTSGLS